MKKCCSCKCFIEDDEKTCIFCGAEQPLESKTYTPVRPILNTFNFSENYNFNISMSSADKDESSDYFVKMVEMSMMDKEDYENYIPKYRIDEIMKPKKKDRYDINYDGYYDNILPADDGIESPIRLSQKKKISQMALFIVVTVTIFMVMMAVMFKLLFPDISSNNKGIKKTHNVAGIITIYQPESNRV